MDHADQKKLCYFSAYMFHPYFPQVMKIGPLENKGLIICELFKSLLCFLSKILFRTSIFLSHKHHSSFQNKNNKNEVYFFFFFGFTFALSLKYTE